MNINITVLLFDANNKIVDVYYGGSDNASKQYHAWVRAYGSDFVSWIPCSV